MFCNSKGGLDREEIMSNLASQYTTRRVDCDSVRPAENQIFVALSFADVASMSSNTQLSFSPTIITNVFQDTLSDVAPPENLRGSYTFFIDPDPRQQLLLSKAILANRPSLLLIYTEATKAIAGNYEAIARSLNIDLRAISVSSEKGTLKSIIKNRDVDGVILIPDKRIYNKATLPSIMRTTYQLDLPLIGFSPVIVKSGALATTFPSLRSQTDYISSIVDEFSKSEGEPLPVTKSGSHSLAVNRIVARSLNLNIAEESILIDNIQNGEL